MPNKFNDDQYRDEPPPRRPARRDDDDREPRARTRRRSGYYRPNSDERSSASMCHLLAIFTGFIGPLIIWSTKKEDSRFVDHHGREALNFSISYLIYVLIATAILTVITVVTCGFGALLFPLMFGFTIWALIAHISAYSAANRGEWYRYGATFRMIGPPPGLEDYEPHRTVVRDFDEGPAERNVAADEDYEPAPRGGGVSVWVWVLGGVGVLLLGGCCVGGVIYGIVEARKTRPVVAAGFATAPARVPNMARNNVAGAVGPIGQKLPDDPVERALVQLKSRDAFERGRAADSLVSIKADGHAKRTQVVKALAEQLRGADQFSRQAAARALVVWTDKDDVPVLLELIKQVSLADKGKVIEKLGRSKDPRAIPPLTEALKEGSVRSNAVEALKLIGPSTEDAVLPLLQDRSVFVKRAACDVLKAVGTKKSLAALEPLAAESNPTTARSAREAIDAIKARHP